MLTYEMDKITPVPLYIKLYESIRTDIESQKLSPHEKLPSKRELAEHLTLSIITVQNAYAQLLSEGYIYTKERIGYFVCELSPAVKQNNNDKETVSLRQICPREDFHSIDLCENSINSKKFPFSLWSRQMRQIISENYDTLLSKIPNMGLWSLREAISVYLYRFRGMEVNPEYILIGAGTEYLYGLIIKLLGREKCYAVEDPGYRRISQIYAAEKLSIQYIPLDRWGLRVDALSKSQADIVYTSPSHNFPTGIVMPVNRRMELLNWAHAKEDRYIIEDEYDSEFRFTGRPLPTMQSRDSEKKTIYMNTFSKTIGPSLRISYMILPPKLAERFHETLSFYACPVCGFEQYILAKFISGGDYERHIRRMRKYYRQMREQILNFIKNSPLGPLSVIKEDLSGLHFVIKLTTHKNDGELKALAKSRGLNISFLSDYYSGQETCNSSELIINYSGIESADMKKAVEILAEII